MSRRAVSAASIALSGGMCLALAACGPTKVSTKTAPDIDKYLVRSVAVMPFDALQTPQMMDQRDTTLPPPDGVVRSGMSLGIPPTVERVNQPTAKVPTQAAEKVTRMVYVKLGEMTTVKVIPPWETGKTVTALEKEAAGQPKERLVRQVASRMSSDAVLIGKVLIYQEREGKFGGTGATVGFELQLIGADGKVLWIGNYFEKQRPMNEDFAGFIERGGVFVTADELAQYGAERVIKYFPFGNPARD
jgi:hypothetical protein